MRLHLLTRKSLGGLHTNLKSQVLGEDGEVEPGLYAAGEVAGFGGGGYHGYNALEGTFFGWVYILRFEGGAKTLDVALNHLINLACNQIVAWPILRKCRLF